MPSKAKKKTQENQSANKTKQKETPSTNKDMKSGTTKSPSSCNELQSQGKDLLDPDTVNGAEMTMTQLYEIIRTLAADVYDKKIPEVNNLEQQIQKLNTEVENLKQIARKNNGE